MTVLLYGSDGWIGGLLAEELRLANVGVHAARARADDLEAVMQELVDVQPRLVFSAIGRTHGVVNGEVMNSIDYLEGRLDENLRDNLVAPLLLAEACKRAGIHYACIATGCIFAAPVDKIDARPFDEAAEPNFTGSGYSSVKGATERLLQACYAESALWFRIRMPLAGKHPRSFLTKILGYNRICSVRNSMTVLTGEGGLLKLFVAMALAGYRGCYNGTNPGTMSHNEILSLFRELVDPSLRWENFSVEEQAQVLRCGRSNNRLCTRKLEAAAAELRLPLLPLDAAVRKLLEGA